MVFKLSLNKLLISPEHNNIRPEFRIQINYRQQARCPKLNKFPELEQNC